MMKMAFRVTALFAVYSAIGFGGDYAAALLGRDRPAAEAAPEVVTVVEPAADVMVDVRPEVRVDVQVRHSSECSFTDVREMTVRAEGMTGVSIDVGSGELRVEGREGLDDIVVASVACASVEEWLDELEVTAESRAGSIDLVAHYPDRDGWRGDNTARLDLTVLVPAGFAVAIDDSSGDIVVRGTGDLRIDDSSGSIQVSDVDGSVSIEDSSGEVEVAGVTGDLQIEDGSGSVEIVSVGGSVAIRDGSGGVEIVDVGRDVLIEEDGSGGIDVRTVGGDFVVADDGNGSIRYSDVAGRVDVPEDHRRKRRRPGR